MAEQILAPSERIDTFKYAHTAATTAKAPLLINSRVVIPLNDAGADTDNVFCYRAPLVQVDKNSAEAWTPLAKIYWDDTNKVFTTADGAGANTLAGIAVAAAANPSSTGLMELNPATFA